MKRTLAFLCHTRCTQATNYNPSPKPYKFVPLTMGGNGRTHVVTRDSKRLIEEEVSLADLEKMTELFYHNVFLDPTLDQFIRSRNDPHGSRFAKWIHQKLSDSSVWDDQDRQTRDLKPVTLSGGFKHVVHDRSSAHAAAWYSPKRPVRMWDVIFNLMSAVFGCVFTFGHCENLD